MSGWHSVLPVLPESIRTSLQSWDPGLPVEEIRLRAGRPALVQLTDGERAVPGPPVAAAVCQRALQLCCEHSVYAWEEALRAGYVTVTGGHRVGVAGRAVVAGGHVQTIQPVTALNYRIARAVPGAASSLLPALLCRDSATVHSTVIISPPRAGKTTVLRDLVRQLSDGRPDLGWFGQTVGLVDERSELAGAWQGVPQHDVGKRTDVLDNCPKAVGLMMLIRSMGPRIVAVDELGGSADAAAVREAVFAGVSVLATVHAASIAEARERPGVGELLDGGCFTRAVVLSRRRGPGTVEAVHVLSSGGGNRVRAQTGRSGHRRGGDDVARPPARAQPRAAARAAP